MNIVIKNAHVVNENRVFKGFVVVSNEIISDVFEGEYIENQQWKNYKIIDAEGLHLFPGLIDDQVHFREPGLTHKADIYSESRAAVAGGITSFMEMPNTSPPTLTQELLEQKYQIAEEKSIANYSFFMGASNDNLEEVLKTNPRNVCGVKIFMGSSTGNMLVDNTETLKELFSQCKMLIATHCEDEATIRQNSSVYKEKYGDNVPIEFHPAIRNEEACYKSSSMAAELAAKHSTRLHILHISTEKELSLFSNKHPLSEKKITSEACIHHLWFSEDDYKTKGTLIKWNPAVKKASDREAIIKAVNDNRIDVIATDHAPHTIDEKQNSYFKAPSGGPLVQHSLVALLELYKQGKFSLEKIAEKASHSVADLFRIEKRGYICKGYYADLVLVNLNSPWTVEKSNLLYKCKWSPFENTTFSSKITHTFVNGNLVYENGKINDNIGGQRLLFNSNL